MEKEGEGQGRGGGEKEDTIDFIWCLSYLKQSG